MNTVLAATLLLLAPQGGKIVNPNLEGQKEATEAKQLAGFLHSTNKLNVANNWTTLDHPTLNGKPQSILIVTRYGQPREDAAPIGVWYNAGKWTIFNQDKSPMKSGQKFVVEVFEKNKFAFEHRFNGSGNYSSPIREYDLPKQKGYGLFVTPVYSDSAVYNINPCASWFDGKTWTVYQANQAPLDPGASFHVVYAKAYQAGKFDDGEENGVDSPNEFRLDLPFTNGQGEVLLSVGPTYLQVNDASIEDPFSVAWFGTGWKIATWEEDIIPEGSGFYVRIAGKLPLEALTTTEGSLTQAESYRLTCIGFRCIKETADDILERDGKGDEIVLLFDRAIDDGKSDPKPLPFLQTAFFGDVNRPDANLWIQAGSRGSTGGIKAGDSFPENFQVAPTGASGSLPMVIWEGRLQEGGPATVVVPAVFEQDSTGTSLNRRLYPGIALRAGAEERGMSALGALVPYIARNDRGDYAVGIRRFSVRRRVNNRKTIQRTGFSSPLTRIYLNRGNAAQLATAQGAFGIGTFAIKQGTEATDKGAYEVFYRIERI